MAPYSDHRLGPLPYGDQGGGPELYPEEQGGPEPYSEQGAREPYGEDPYSRRRDDYRPPGGVPLFPNLAPVRHSTDIWLSYTYMN